MAPTHVTVPSGSNVRLEYDTPMCQSWPCGCKSSSGARKRRSWRMEPFPVMLHILSPAKRPVQVTKELSSFWATAYQEVRKELRGRYPKHAWPEDPERTADCQDQTALTLTCMIMFDCVLHCLER